MFIIILIINIGYTVPSDAKKSTFVFVLPWAVELKNSNICFIVEAFIINYFFPESLNNKGADTFDGSAKASSAKTLVQKLLQFNWELEWVIIIFK